MGKLLVYLKDYKKECVLAPLFKMLEASFELFVPLVIAALIDQGIGGADRGMIWSKFGLLVLLAAIGLVSAVSAQFFAAKAAVGFATKLRKALFSHIQTLSFAEMDRVGSSTLITRMTSDINQVQSCVNMVLRLFLRSPFIVFGAMIMAFQVNVKAALVFVVTIPLLSIVVFTVMVVTIPMFTKVQRNLDLVLRHTRENLTGVRVIRAFRKEDEEIAQFNEDNEKLTSIQRAVGRISGLTNPLTFVIINASIVAVIWIGGKQVYSGIITQGQVVALVSYMSQILVELIKLANLIVNITKSIACGNRIQEVFEMTPSIQSPSMENEESTLSFRHKEQDKNQNSVSNSDNLRHDDNEKNILEFDHVSMRYTDAAEDALTDINLQVKKGQTIGIIGGTGSGKSTVVQMIPRFYDAREGRLLVKGMDVRDYNLTELRNLIGIVQQQAVLFAGTIRENLCWGKADASDQELMKAIELAQAGDVVAGKKEGLDFLIEQGGKNLSGGQRQRLTIARALVKKPEILILDDSASALDFATDARLRKALKTLEDVTTIIVSQRTSSIQHADQIMVLDDGEVVGLGRHEELLENCQVYREIYDSQFKSEAKEGK